jgi:hypothetical protein
MKQTEFAMTYLDGRKLDDLCSSSLFEHCTNACSHACNKRTASNAKHLLSTNTSKSIYWGAKLAAVVSHAGLRLRASIIFLDYLASGNHNQTHLTKVRELHTIST